MAAALIAVTGSVFASITLDAGEHFNLASGETFTIDGGLNIGVGSTLDATAGASNLYLSGDWYRDAAGVFNSGTGTVFFDGAGTSNISNSNTFYNFTCTTASKQLTFQDTLTQTVTNTLNLNGQAPGSEIKLRSSTTGTRWTFNVTGGAQNASYVDVKDSNASSNNITANNSINSGNNDDAEPAPHWVFGAPIFITSPVASVTVGQRPTIIGYTTVAHTAYTIKGISGGVTVVVASGTSDSNGNFRIQIGAATPLDLGANSLIPYIGSTAGSARSITVVAAPTTAQVPTIVTPAEGANITTNPFVVTGFAVANTEVRLQALDINGNLVLNCGSVTSNPVTGAYTISCNAITFALAAGANVLTVTTYDGLGNAITSSLPRNINFTDPFGIVFDSVSDNPIGGATVSIYYDNDPGPGRTWILAVPGVQIGAGDANPQTTGPTGFYSYNCINGDFYIKVNAGGYNYPSSKSSFPVGRVIIVGSKSEPFTVAGAVLNIDMPLDPTLGLLKLEKSANKKNVSVGDIITYTVTIQNISTGDVSNVYLEDAIPAGFKYLNGKVILDSAKIADPAGNRPVTFNIGTVSHGATRTLKYQLIVGSGVTFDKYQNRVVAKYSDGTIISNPATETVRVIPDSLFDLGTVIGKVFNDKNENGIQDKDEEPISNVQIATEEGTVITTDKDGKFHLPSIKPGRHLFRLDERTLPDGAYLTTDKVVLVDITQGLLVKVNFGVKLPSGTKTGQMPFSIAQDRGIAQRRLNVAVLNPDLVIKDNALVEKAQFRMFTNYQLFINKWLLEIIDSDTQKVIKSFKGNKDDIFAPVYWDGKDVKGEMIKTDRKYAYRLTVLGANNKKDITRPRNIGVTLYKQEALDIKKEEKTEAQKQKEYRDWLVQESSVNSVAVQGIVITGETIKVTGSNYQNVKVLNGSKTIVDMPVIEGPGLTAADLLKNNGQAASIENSVDVILPEGDYQVQVMPVQAQASSIEKPHLVGAGVVLPADSQTLTSNDVYSKHVKVGDNYLFFVAMGDVKMGYTFNPGNVEPVQKDDKYKPGFWAEGRAAYYLKGKIKGKYIITSSFDSDRNNTDLFKYIDPDKYYPVYGDNSSTNYAATNTQGPLYLLIEWDKSSLLWGDYNTALTDTEFAQFSRSLYGAKGHLETVSTTQFGEPNAKLVVFRAQARQKSAHNEFLGTGGSLFYLQNKDVTEGSEKVKIEVRDAITGLVLGTDQMKAGVDYEIDYPNGRIIFWQPVSQLVESSSIISNNLLAGNPVYVVVDYEYANKDKYNEATVGARAQKSITDYVSIGGTYVNEEQEQGNYELTGGDATVHLGKNIKVVAEYAQSRAQAMGNFISTDGGISFTALPTPDLASGKAYGVKGEAHLFDNRLGLFSYFKRIENGFSNTATTSQQGKELTGFGITYDLAANTRLTVSHDIQKLLDDGNPMTQAQVGATKTETTSAQISHAFTTKRLTLTGEFRHQGVTEKKDQFDTQTNQEADLLAVRADYKLTKKIDVSLEQQAAITGSPDNETTLSVVARPYKWVSLRAKETIGNLGTATSFGATSKVNDKIEVSGDYTKTISATGEIGSVRSLTATAKVNDDTTLHSTYGLTESGASGNTNSFSLGTTTKRQISDKMYMTLDRTYTSLNDVGSFNDTVGVAREADGRRFEGTFTRQNSESATEISRSNIFGLNGDINDKWAAQGTFEKGMVQNLDGTQTERYAGSFGLGFVNKDKVTGEVNLKASLKLELRYDASQENSRQGLLYSTIEGKINPDTTVFGKVNISETRDLTTNSTQARYKELVFGMAYRPIKCDWLNLLAEYTYLENDSPSSQTDISDIQRVKAHVLAGEAIIDLNSRWQLSEKLALRMSEEQVAGFDFTRSSTWLAIQRVNYRIYDDWKVGAEYRQLGQLQAKDLKQGLLLELSRRMGDYLEIGAGYNFTDFSDDLTVLSYTAQGPFLRMTGKFYDRTPEEIDRARRKKIVEQAQN